MMTIILCFVEALIELVVVLGVVITPFFVVAFIYKGIECLVEFFRTDYHSDTRKANMHRKVYDFLIDKGYDSDVAYRKATKLTHWE